MLQKKNVTKLLSTITLSSALLLSATVVAGNEQANVVEASTNSVRLTHNAYVYDQKGNVVKKHGKKVLLKKNQWISALNNADKYVIKGRLYYKLADGQFVKVANTVTKKAKLRKTVVS